MDPMLDNDSFGSSYKALPKVPEALVDRNFRVSDGNVEITSMDIAPHGAFVVAGTSSGMVLLFDMSNPYCQKDGLLIGQIRARGMHTNLILTVKFSEDGRFVFAGVSKGSSEMLAIDLGKVLVEWHSSHRSDSFSDSSRATSEAVQQLQLQSMVTFSFSDAKLRGFGAVVRMDLPHSSESRKPHGSSNSSSFADSSALYRLACGRGIKNVHIWHFTVGYLVSDATNEQLPQQTGGGGGQRMMHGKWEYVCDVASNGNTITHIEFRRSGHELLSKSAGMGIRLWDLSGGDATTSTSSGNAAALAITDATPSPASASAAEAAQGNTTQLVDPVAVSPPTGAAAVAGSTCWLIKPSYTDISNSQDVKCLLPVGSGAYGGTYQFAVLNTSAPKEANRDVLELPERFSGDAALAGTGAGTAASSSNNLLRGRRITREIEQVICTDEGAHALLLCADGGVVYYHAPVEAAARTSGDSTKEGGEEEDASGGGGSSSSNSSMRGSGAGSLVELSCLFRQKDLQQHTGSWALRRVGHQGLVVLLRAYPESGSSSGAVVIEARLLAEHLPQDACQRLLDELAVLEKSGASRPQLHHQQLLYYQDSTSHLAQEAARKAWKALPASVSSSAAKRSISSAAGGTYSSSQKAAKKVKLSSAEAAGGGEGESMDTFSVAHIARKKSGGNLISGEKSPRSSSAHLPPVSAEKRHLLVTPAAAAPPSANKLNKFSPYDAADRLVSSEKDGTRGGGSGSPLTGLMPPTAALPLPFPRSSRLSHRQQQHGGSSSLSSFARLRALRDDDSSAGEEDAEGNATQQLPPKVHSYKELEVGPAPKVQRLRIPSLPASWMARTPAAATATAAPTNSSAAAFSSVCLEAGPQEGENATLAATARAVYERWANDCGGNPVLLLPASPFKRKEEGGAVLGLAGRSQQQALGSTALQRLGVIHMEQDRLKAQFIREVSTQVQPLTVSGGFFATPTGSDAALKSMLGLVGHYRSASQEMVQRQQLELQGAYAIDSICNAAGSSSKTPSSLADSSSCGCWGEGLKVVNRHEAVFTHTETLHRSLAQAQELALRGPVSATPVGPFL